MKLTIFRSKEAPILYGHPWIFPKAIKDDPQNLPAGSWVTVYSESGEWLGSGVYNPHSLYRVRILQRKDALFSLETTIEYHLRKALALRTTLLLPNALTNAYRLLNSEADGLSGLTIDRFNNTLVIAPSAYWAMEHKDLILHCIKKVLPLIAMEQAIEQIVWHPQNKALVQDGWSSPEEPKKEPFSPTQVLENGIAFHVDFNQMQKTGLYLDQRENHELIGALAQGKNVLDLYTYTGGFALHAAKGGAISITAVDSSKEAISIAKQNAELNHYSNIEFLTGDAREYLTQAGKYDLVILDPPKLIPSQKHLSQAKNYYRFLHREIFRTMKEDSLLLTCNCSYALSTQDFLNLISEQAFLEKRTIQLLGIYGPSRCHPILPSFPEGQYLTALLLAL
ncbi:MAG TPA: class I SAM-dependent rRNA methyltransferase [Chlamydiales bacterium]|nr:class I SAM-dependent rRNA methyltransferase [Chlamydiales bacterium]